MSLASESHALLTRRVLIEHGLRTIGVAMATATAPAQDLPAPREKGPASQYRLIPVGGAAFFRDITSSQDGRWFALDSGTVWDVQAGRVVGQVKELSALVMPALSRNGKFLVFARSSREILSWELATGELTTLTQLESDVVAIHFSPDERAVAYAGTDGTIELFDIPSGRKRRFLFTRSDTPGTIKLGRGALVAFSADGKLLVCGGYYETAVWSTETGKVVRSLPQGYQGEAMTPGGDTLITLRNQNTITIWDVQAGKQTRAFDLPAGGNVLPESFSPDGKWYVRKDQAYMTGSIDLYDISTGLKTRSFRVPTQSTNVSFSANGKWLFATAAQYEPIRVFEIASGKELAQLLCGGRNEWSQWAVLAPDGRFDASREATPRRGFDAPSFSRLFWISDGKDSGNLEKFQDHYSPGLLKELLR